MRTDSFFGFTPDVATQLRASGDFSAVTGLQQGPMQVDGSTKQFSAMDFPVIEELLQLEHD